MVSEEEQKMDRMAAGSGGQYRLHREVAAHPFSSFCVAAIKCAKLALGV